MSITREPQNSWILHELECPVCTEYMHPPIKQCVQGHSICESCHSKLDKCPTCRNTLTTARCFVLEQLHSKLLFPCKNKEDGCTLVCEGLLIKKHEETCTYGRQRCPLYCINLCPWHGSPKDMLKHCKDKHPLNVYFTNMQMLTCKGFKKTNQQSRSYHIIFNAHYQMFKFSWELNSRTKVMKWCVYYVGSAELSNKFMYEIIFENKKTSLKKLKISAPCEPIAKENSSNETCVLTHYDMMCKYCWNEDLLYKVRILCKY